MPDDRSLLNICTQQTIDTTLTLKDTLTETDEWDLNFLTTNLPHITVNQLVAIPTPKETDGSDSIGWAGTNTRHFTMQSAYNLQRERYRSIEGIGRVCGVGKDLTEFKLSCGLLLMSAF